MSEKVAVLITVPDEENAARIGRVLVEERLAACANIVKGIRSIYRWKEEIFDEPECMLIIKTVADNFTLLENRVRELHPYEVPEVIAVKISEGSKPYLDWIEENTRLG
ncbi:MAG: divalent-cation tolerance protein CutA [Nitrospirota bacterium]